MTTMTTNRTPATPLPWHVSPIAPREVQQESAIWGVCQCGIDGDRNAPYIAHTANAYPKLVEALRSTLELIYSAGDMADSRTYKLAAALLKELGE